MQAARARAESQGRKAKVREISLYFTWICSVAQEGIGDVCRRYLEESLGGGE